MKKALLCALVALAFSSCNASTSGVQLSQRFVDYPIDNDEYVIVYVKDGESKGQARKKAMERAGEVTVSNGYRYFKVYSEEEVQVAKTSPGQRSFSGNMYQEQIVEKGFGREQFSDFPEQRTGMYPAFRLVIKCYTKKPMGKAYDACDYTHCGS